MILAAGYGMRMVPINLDVPKGLLEVRGEPLIERLIRQLHEAKIYEIYIVVGFMKEKYEYLIDEFGVELIVNREYASKNNLHSLKLVLDRLSDSYIIPCDIWCRENPFHQHELYSWYMVSDELTVDSEVRVNRKKELVTVPKDAEGNAMIGIAYLQEEICLAMREKIRTLVEWQRYFNAFWEVLLMDKKRLIIPGRVVKAADVVEINTYEQLRDFDRDSNHLHSEAIDVIAEVFHVKPEDITHIAVLKKGMTNRSFRFTCRGEEYILRIPGEGTEQLINRQQEAAVYREIRGRGLCDDVVYINPHNGFKITRYLKGVRTADPESEEDLKICVNKLRDFHNMGLEVEHEFQIFEQIDLYEELRNGVPSMYKDYQETKRKVLLLKEYVNAHVQQWTLTHIDAVPDNFLFYLNDQGEEQVQLTDWEYAGMQDPHVDIAMFCIYSLYNKTQVDHLIDLYFCGKCPAAIRAKIYCYVAICGLLWSNWCEYKRVLGVEFGEYSLRQYRYAKEYYRYAVKEMEKLDESSR